MDWLGFLASLEQDGLRVKKHDLGRMEHKCQYCGAFHWLNERLLNSRVTEPKFSLCCYLGKVQLPPPSDPPPELLRLFREQSSDAVEFRTNIRQYNAAFAFTSLGTKLNERMLQGGGPYSFRIDGELYHQHGSLLPLETNNRPVYAQLYFYDPQIALSYRMARNDGLKEATMRKLQDIILQYNPWIRIYHTAKEILEKQPRTADMAVAIHFVPGTDQRCYNAPTSTEIAAILPGQGDEQTDGQDIVVQLRGGDLKRIHHGSPAYIPLHYTLIYPKGDQGWHYHMTLAQGQESRGPAHNSDDNNEGESEDGSENEHGGRGRNQLSCARYHAYRIHWREQQNGLLLMAGKLFQQYVVDAWAQIEQAKLSWARFNQSTLRAEVYSGLADAIGHGESLNQIGKCYILPSSHVGSPRFMQQLYQDSMGICRKYVKPTFFTTMTANPNWEEIRRELLPGQTPADRPDLVARVFALKLKHLRKRIKKDGVLGKMIAFVLSIEYQKRGLPHAHMLDFIDPQDQPKCSEDVDKLISAQLPDKDKQPELWSLVTKLMMHGPCGAANPNALCMVDGKCSKNFPKTFRESSTLDGNGYADYARPNNGRGIEKNGIWLDNHWVVPYCPELLLEFQCHINTECCITVAAVKYIHKYIYKGPDRATLKITDKENLDEIKQYLDARWIGASETVWHILRQKMHNESPPVYRLQVYNSFISVQYAPHIIF